MTPTLKACTICGRPTTTSRCPAHKIKRARGRAGQQRRARTLTRDNHTCRNCGHHDPTGRTLHADHRHALAGQAVGDPEGVLTADGH